MKFSTYQNVSGRWFWKVTNYVEEQPITIAVSGHAFDSEAEAIKEYKELAAWICGSSTPLPPVEK